MPLHCYKCLHKVSHLPSGPQTLSKTNNANKYKMAQTTKNVPFLRYTSSTNPVSFGTPTTPFGSISGNGTSRDDNDTCATDAGHSSITPLADALTARPATFFCADHVAPDAIEASLAILSGGKEGEIAGSVPVQEIDAPLDYRSRMKRLKVPAAPDEKQTLLVVLDPNNAAPAHRMRVMISNFGRVAESFHVPDGASGNNPFTNQPPVSSLALTWNTIMIGDNTRFFLPLASQNRESDDLSDASAVSLLTMSVHVRSNVIASDDFTGVAYITACGVLPPLQDSTTNILATTSGNRYTIPGFYGQSKNLHDMSLERGFEVVTFGDGKVRNQDIIPTGITDEVNHVSLNQTPAAGTDKVDVHHTEYNATGLVTALQQYVPEAGFCAGSRGQTTFYGGEIQFSVNVTFGVDGTGRNNEESFVQFTHAWGLASYNDTTNDYVANVTYTCTYLGGHTDRRNSFARLVHLYPPVEGAVYLGTAVEYQAATCASGDKLVKLDINYSLTFNKGAPGNSIGLILLEDVNQELRITSRSVDAITYDGEDMGSRGRLHSSMTPRSFMDVRSLIHIATGRLPFLFGNDGHELAPVDQTSSASQAAMKSFSAAPFESAKGRKFKNFFRKLGHKIGHGVHKLEQGAGRFLKRAGHDVAELAKKELPKMAESFLAASLDQDELPQAFQLHEKEDEAEGGGAASSAKFSCADRALTKPAKTISGNGIRFSGQPISCTCSTDPHTSAIKKYVNETGQGGYSAADRASARTPSLTRKKWGARSGSKRKSEGEIHATKPKLASQRKDITPEMRTLVWDKARGLGTVNPASVAISCNFGPGGTEVAREICDGHVSNAKMWRLNTTPPRYRCVSDAETKQSEETRARNTASIADFLLTNGPSSLGDVMQATKSIGLSKSMVNRILFGLKEDGRLSIEGRGVHKTFAIHPLLHPSTYEAITPPPEMPDDDPPPKEVAGNTPKDFSCSSSFHCASRHEGSVPPIDEEDAGEGGFGAFHIPVGGIGLVDEDEPDGTGQLFDLPQQFEEIAVDDQEEINPIAPVEEAGMTIHERIVEVTTSPMQIPDMEKAQRVGTEIVAGLLQPDHKISDLRGLADWPQAGAEAAFEQYIRKPQTPKFINHVIPVVSQKSGKTDLSFLGITGSRRPYRDASYTDTDTGYRGLQVHIDTKLDAKVAQKVGKLLGSILSDFPDMYPRDPQSAGGERHWFVTYSIDFQVGPRDVDGSSGTLAMVLAFLGIPCPCPITGDVIRESYGTYKVVQVGELDAKCTPFMNNPRLRELYPNLIIPSDMLDGAEFEGPAEGWYRLWQNSSRSTFGAGNPYEGDGRAKGVNLPVIMVEEVTDVLKFLPRLIAAGKHAMENGPMHDKFGYLKIMLSSIIPSTQKGVITDAKTQKQKIVSLLQTLQNALTGKAPVNVALNAIKRQLAPFQESGTKGQIPGLVPTTKLSTEVVLWYTEQQNKMKPDDATPAQPEDYPYKPVQIAGKVMQPVGISDLITYLSHSASGRARVQQVMDKLDMKETTPSGEEKRLVYMKKNPKTGKFFRTLASDVVLGLLTMHGFIVPLYQKTPGSSDSTAVTSDLEIDKNGSVNEVQIAAPQIRRLDKKKAEVEQPLELNGEATAQIVLDNLREAQAAAALLAKEKELRMEGKPDAAKALNAEPLSKKQGRLLALEKARALRESKEKRKPPANPKFQDE